MLKPAFFINSSKTGYGKRGGVGAGELSESPDDVGSGSYDRGFNTIRLFLNNLATQEGKRTLAS